MRTIYKKRRRGDWCPPRRLNIPFATDVSPGYCRALFVWTNFFGRGIWNQVVVTASSRRKSNSATAGSRHYD